MDRARHSAAARIAMPLLRAVFSPPPMSPRSRFVSIDVALTAAFVFAFASVPAQAASHIRGLITGETGHPISEALVTATFHGPEMPPRPYPPDEEAQARTGPDGRYDLVIEHPACYLVGAVAAGHQQAFYPGVTEAWNATCVEVAAEGTADGIDIRLLLAGAIAGLITDERTGEPIAGAFIAAMPAFWDSTGGTIPPNGEPGQGWTDPGGRGGGDGTAISDSTGSYLIDGLAAGEYLVYASASDHIGEFYRDSPNPDGATPVVVEPPHTTFGIDLALGRGGCIHGQVTDEANGTPIAGAFVRLGGGFVQPEPGGGAVTDSDGNYSLCALSPGDYVVQASADGYLGEYYDEAPCWRQADPVAVPEDGDVLGIDFTLGRGGRIEGRIGDGNAPVPGAFVQAWPAVHDSTFSGDPDDCPAEGWGGATTADSLGNYVLAGLSTGRYLVLAEAPDFLPTFYGGGQDPQSATPVAVTAPGVTPGIDIVLERGGAIAGVVSDETTGAPIVGAWVEVYLPWMSLPWMNGGPGIRHPWAALTDPAGAYRIAGIPGGKFLIFASAWDQGYEAEFYREASTSETATEVEVVPPGETPNIDFTLKRSAPIDGAIGGRVVAEENGEPLMGAVVTAISLAGHSGFSVADSAGFYWINSLPGGEYVVLAAAAGRVGLFYHQALSWQDATPVQVEGRILGIDFVLAPLGSGPGMISGRILDASGSGIAQAYIYAEPEQELGASGFATSASNGRYLLTGLEPGRYRIRATRPGMADAYYAGGDPRGPAELVQVERGMVEGVDIVLGAGAAPAPAPGLRAEPSVPNPFRDEVAIRVTTDRADAAITVDLYDVRGRHVRRLTARSQSAGRQEIPWDGRDQANGPAPSGVYIYRAQAAGKSVGGRLVLLR